VQLRIRCRNLELSSEIRRVVERKLRLLLARHAPAIDHASVTLAPVAGRGGSDSRRCRIHLRLHRGPNLVVEDDAGDVLAAVSNAAWRLDHRLGRRASGLPASHDPASGPASPRNDPRRPA